MMAKIKLYASFKDGKSTMCRGFISRGIDALNNVG